MKTSYQSRATLYGAKALLAASVLFALGCVAEPEEASKASSSAIRAADQPFNVLLFTFDTTRADFLGSYGRKDASTPNLDRLAAEGVRFEHAISSNPVTQPAHSTILTGVYPMVHGVRDNLLFRLPEERQTLAELLSGNGYRTGAAIGGFPLTREFGTHQGFDLYDDDLTARRRDHRGRPAPWKSNTYYEERPAADVNDAILPFLREKTDRPFFAWLHYWDPHEPLIAPPPFGQLFAHSPYDGEIAYADANFGKILAELDHLGVAERTIVIMTSDHGEGHNEHGEATHAFLAYDTTLHVPLIISVPGQHAGTVVAQTVGTVDIVPTVLDLLGLEVPEEIQGRSLVPLMEREGADSLRAVAAGEKPSLHYAESLSPRLSHGFGELRALYSGTKKYIHGPRPELYDLATDPQELRNLLLDQPSAAEPFEATLRDFLNRHSRPEAGDAAFEASEETREKLAALGYIETTADRSAGVSEELLAGGIAPQDHVGSINQANLLRRQIASGQFGRARQLAESLLKDAPRHGYYRAQLAAALNGLGKVEQAAAIVDSTEELSSANARIFLAVARTLFESGSQERAVAMARRILRASDSANGRLILGNLLLEQGDGTGFDNQLRRGLAKTPHHRDSHLALANYHIDNSSEDPNGGYPKGIERAETHLAAIFERNPSDIEARLSLAKLERKRGRNAEALSQVERVLRMSPRSCAAHREKQENLRGLERTAELESAKAAMPSNCANQEGGRS